MPGCIPWGEKMFGFQVFGYFKLLGKYFKLSLEFKEDLKDLRKEKCLLVYLLIHSTLLMRQRNASQIQTLTLPYTLCIMETTK